ncbi:hypothetical protein [Agrilutibacter solisilvae]|uniref:Uncharacterized protein n=1 Tax=Agrilutibacter solisilvae TaxID=2763317 RepID=A0A974Y1C8_9GAMM|nr:hypothetical protein [Lysobacter solisilvae]QSX79514.1 hypothetical protein I8J32_006550 [Lysobacter solisilvae]
MKPLILFCALLAAMVPARATAVDEIDPAIFAGKRIYVYVRAPAAFRENVDDKVQLGVDGKPFGYLLAKDQPPLPPLADPAVVVASRLVDILAATQGAVAVRGTERDYEFHLQTYRWGFAPNARMPGRYYVHQGVEIKVVRSSDRRVIAEQRCHPDTRLQADAPTLERLGADQARVIRVASDQLAWHCAREIAQSVLHVPPGKLPPVPPAQ